MFCELRSSYSIIFQATSMKWDFIQERKPQFVECIYSMPSTASRGTIMDRISTLSFYYWCSLRGTLRVQLTKSADCTLSDVPEFISVGFETIFMKLVLLYSQTNKNHRFWPLNKHSRIHSMTSILKPTFWYLQVRCVQLPRHSRLAYWSKWIVEDKKYC